MKTSVIEAHDMLSVSSVDEVEKRIGEVPGVHSVTSPSRRRTAPRPGASRPSLAADGGLRQRAT